MTTTLPLPSTLNTATPAEGRALAHQFATTLFAASAQPVPTSMADSFHSSAANRPSLESITAIYFHAISITNAGWRQ